LFLAGWLAGWGAVEWIEKEHFVTNEKMVGDKADQL
jgi:hypothetical protein